MEDKEFTTTDISTAAFLITNKKIEFLGLTLQTAQVWGFNFQPSHLAQTLAFRFLCGKERVNGLDYSLAIKRCKDLVFSEKRKCPTHQ